MRDRSADWNPLATKEQIDLDFTAINIYQRLSFSGFFSILRFFARNTYRLVHALRFSFPDANQELETAVDELVFSAIQKAVNNDPSSPHVYWVNAGQRILQHQNGLQAIPGGRYCYDNPDVIYRTVPVSADYRYMIHGVRHDQLADTTFSLIRSSNSHRAVCVLKGEYIRFNEDGQSYDITIDSSPSINANHLRADNTTCQLFIRHTFSKWDALPDTLSVEVVDKSSRFFYAEQEIATKARYHLAESIFFYAVGALGIKTLLNPVNYLPQPEQSLTLGTLMTQASSFGHFSIHSEEALLITVKLGSAGYFVLPISSPWLLTPDPGHYQCSLNNFQAIANPDLSYTFVVSVKDPGVYNWVDTAGMCKGTIMARWQNFSSEQAPKPTIHTKVVALRDLHQNLPQHTKWVSAAERESLLQKRRDDYRKRMFCTFFASSAEKVKQVEKTAVAQYSKGLRSLRLCYGF